ncbi:MAG: heparinase II/III family protein [Armatimonadetes bacterium]|nr:heparinase II/III family protein [Armatimonadota bacterium]
MRKELVIMEGIVGLILLEGIAVGAEPAPNRNQALAHLRAADARLLQSDYAGAERACRELLDTPRASAEDRTAAEWKLDFISVVRRLRPEHPRLFFNRETWPAVKSRALNEERKLLDAWRTSVAGIPDELPASDWGKRLMQAAFVYRVNRDPALFAKIQRMMLASLDFYEQTYAGAKTDNPNKGEVRAAGLDYPFTRIAWLAALDWLWEEFPAGERQRMAARMARHAHHHLTRFPKYRTWGADFYNSDNMYWYAGLVLLGPELDAADRARALALLEEGYSDHRKMFRSRGVGRDDDGDPGVNAEYTLAAGGLHTEYQFLFSWQAAVDPEIPAEWLRSELFPNCVLWNTLPGSRHFGIGFAWHKDNRFFAGLLDAQLTQYVHFFGKRNPELAATAGYFRQKLAAEWWEYRLPLAPFLLTGLSRTPAPRLPENLPLARHIETGGLVYMRSGHGENDTYALFNIGGGRQHSIHRDTTHFTLFKRGYLALDTGTRQSSSPTGGYPAEGHTSEYSGQTVAHNCVLIRMPGEVFPGYWGPEEGYISGNAGGQSQHSKVAKALAFETGPYYSYAASDATATYHPEKCAQMVRQFLFLMPDYFVVFDRVTSTKAEYPKTWLLHTVNEPLVAGREFRADHEQGRIFCRMLLPADAVLEGIGGPGKEFWADGRNWEISEAWWEQYGKDLNRRIPDTMGRWRVEVKPGAARKEDCFLHLIQVSERSVGQMVESRVTENGDQITLVFSAGPRTHTIRLNKSGDIGGHVRIEENGRRLVDKDLTRDIAPQAGLALVTQHGR